MSLRKELPPLSIEAPDVLEPDREGFETELGCGFGLSANDWAISHDEEVVACKRALGDDEEQDVEAAAGLGIGAVRRLEAGAFSPSPG
jgi:hypothetical protein